MLDDDAVQADQADVDQDDEQAKPAKRANGDAKPKRKKKYDKIRFIKTGPVTFAPAISVAPIMIGEGTISKRFPLEERKLVVQQSTPAPGGRKFVEHAIYTCRIFVNPHLARHTYVTDEDIVVLKALLKHIFTFSASCSRPGGLIRMLHVWWRDHEKILGSFDDHEFYSCLTPKATIDGDVYKYDIPVSDVAEDLK